jgi:hypothetical protein
MRRPLILSALLVLALLVRPQTSSAQPYQVLFPGMTGQELREAIADTYSPVAVLSLEES